MASRSLSGRRTCTPGHGLCRASNRRTSSKKNSENHSEDRVFDLCRAFKRRTSSKENSEHQSEDRVFDYEFDAFRTQLLRNRNLGWLWVFGPPTSKAQREREMQRPPTADRQTEDGILLLHRFQVHHDSLVQQSIFRAWRRCRF